jgi:predicted chitinase
MIARNILMAIGTPADTADKWVPWLNMTMINYEITTPQRQAMFLAQLAHESGSLSTSVRTSIIQPKPCDVSSKSTF